MSFLKKESRTDVFVQGYNAGLVAFKTALLSINMKKRDKITMESSLDFLIKMLKR